MFVSPESSPGRNFYPRPPRGGRRSPTVFGWGVFLFLSTPSARRATVFFQTHSWFFSYFYPRPPRGGRRAARVFAKSAMDFYPRPPRGGRRLVLLISAGRIYFYPRPPRGGRPAPQPVVTFVNLFLSTPSARRATRRSEQSRHVSAYFYPRPPRGGRRLVLLISAGRIYFYPRPPRGGRPHDVMFVCQCNFISIHALREEGDAGREGRRGRPGNFYPRPPRGGRL